MISPAQELCDRHDYPEELRAILEELGDAARRAYPSMRSLILGGSTSTGDYVWRKTAEGVELISDIDAMLYVEPGAAARPDLLREKIAGLERAHVSPLFHIDVAVSPVSALRRIAPSFQMAETKQSGVVLAGSDVRDAFPDRFDPRSPRRSSLANLWKAILHWGPPGEEIDMTYTQVVARIFLDLAILLGSEQGECVPGHRRRARRFLETSGRSALSNDSARERVRWALEMREQPRAQREGLELGVAEHATHLLRALGCPSPDARPSHALARHLEGWLPPRDWRRFAGEARALVSSGSIRPRDLRWLLRRKEAVAAAVTIGLIHWIAEGMSGAPPGETLTLLAEFCREPILGAEECEDPLELLRDAKGAYWRGQKQLYPSLAKNEASIAAFLATPRKDQESA